MKIFCRDDKISRLGGTPTPRRVPRHRRGYIPEMNNLKAFPPFHFFICLSLCNASSRVVMKPLPNTAKGVFCKKCENGFGLLETICQPLLVKAIEDLQKGTLQLKKIEKGQVAFEIPVHPNHK